MKLIEAGKAKKKMEQMHSRGETERAGRSGHTYFIGFDRKNAAKRSDEGNNIIN